MRSYSSREVLKLLKEGGRYEVNVVSSTINSSIQPNRGVSL